MIDNLINAFKNNDEKMLKDIIMDKSNKEEIGKYLFDFAKANNKLLINGKDKFPDLIKYLDKNGFELDYETDYGNNILMAAVYHNNVKLVKAILESDSFDPSYIVLIGDRVFYDETDEKNETSSALKYALVNNNEEIIDLIFEHLEANISEQDFFLDLALDYIDEEDKYDGIEDELADLTFSAITTAIMYSSVDVVERILSFDDFKLTIYDEMFIDRLDWNTVTDADKKKDLLIEKLGYDFNIYNSALIKNKNCNTILDKTVTLDDIKKRLKNYTKTVLDDDFANLITYQVNSDFVDTYDLVLKSLLFMIAVDLNPSKAEQYKEIINNYSGYSTTFVNICYSFIEKEHDLDFIKEQILPMIDPILKVLMINQSVNFKNYTKPELVSILTDWKNLIAKEKDSKILDEIKTIISNIEFDESLVPEDTEIESESGNNVMFENVSDGIPLEISAVGLSQYRQEYYNAPPSYYSYVGADIVNKNKDYIAENVRVTTTFYDDGMIIDKYEDVIGIIQNDSVFHYGIEYRVDEKYDKYTVRVNSCNFVKNVDNIDYASLFEISNLKYRVDSIEGETKVSCTIRSKFPNYLRKLVVYIQFLKNNKIVAGNYMVQYDLEAFGEYDIVDKIDMAIDCDKVICSIVPEA